MEILPPFFPLCTCLMTGLNIQGNFPFHENIVPGNYLSMCHGLKTDSLNLYIYIYIQYRHVGTGELVYLMRPLKKKMKNISGTHWQLPVQHHQ